MKDSKDKPQIDEIGCLEAINGLYAYLDGEMNDPESIAKFECYSRTELETALGELIRKSAKGKAPEKLQNRLRKLIDGI
ncbi:MAG: hypothetical protein AMJ67_16460 [Betaproteobacteria bacterium SG8_41]|nr:MAG: hypothetical protein AMJ67_16460 [Betaproteobacteria bacterium SG8_41]